jgi:toxin FitB
MVVDSSVWLEVLFSGPLNEKCQKAIASQRLTIPSIVVYEVYNKIKVKMDEAKALEVIGYLSRHAIAELTREIALLAADLSLELKLGMADSLVLAHARFLGVTLLTLDNDFSHISDVKVIR